MSAVENHDFKWKSKKIKVKISCGISTTSELDFQENEQNLILKTDSRIYTAKRSKDLIPSIAYPRAQGAGKCKSQTATH
jgi:GGDEF domain-containing protein